MDILLTLGALTVLVPLGIAFFLILGIAGFGLAFAILDRLFGGRF